MGQVRKFIIMPRRWRGTRDNEPAVLLGPDEWASSLNWDARFGRTNLGSTPVLTLVGSQVITLDHFFDETGTLERVWADSDGDVYEDNVLKDTIRAGSYNLASDTEPVISTAKGLGAFFFFIGDGDPIWYDPSSSTYKTLTSAPVGAGTLDGEVLQGPRLLVAPGTLGSDAIAFTNIGSFIDFITGDSGEEIIGIDREPVIAIAGGLELNTAIYKPNHTYILDGTDPATWTPTLVSSDVGLTAPNTIVKLGKAQFFVHESGAYFLNAIGAISFPSLTFRIQELWDEMVANFGTFLRYAHAAYHPRENTIYLWVPNQANRVMNRLIKIYLADGSVTVHDGKDAGGSNFFPATGAGQLEFGTATKIQKAVGTDDDGTPITVALTPGIFSGNPPTFELEKRWGRRGVLHFFFESTVSGETIKITPNIFRTNSKIAGVQQSFALTANQVSKVKALCTIGINLVWSFSAKPFPMSEISLA